MIFTKSTNKRNSDDSSSCLKNVSLFSQRRHCGQPLGQFAFTCRVTIMQSRSYRTWCWEPNSTHVNWFYRLFLTKTLASCRGLMLMWEVTETQSGAFQKSKQTASSNISGSAHTSCRRTRGEPTSTDSDGRPHTTYSYKNKSTHAFRSTCVAFRARMCWCGASVCSTRETDKNHIEHKSTTFDYF